MSDFIRILEMQMLAEHIKYLRDKSSSGNNNDLISLAKEAYKRIGKQVGNECEE